MSVDEIPPPGWNELCRKGDRLRVQGVGTPPLDDTERASLSGATPSGLPKRTHGALPYPDSLGEAHSTLKYHTRVMLYPTRAYYPNH